MRTKYAVLCLTIFLSAFALTGHCGDSELSALFAAGNKAYSEERFAVAADLYEKALEPGPVSGPLYYNLGNAYFKLNDLGRAILNYSRAKRLMPLDADLKSNLMYANSLIKGGTPPPSGNWFTRMLSSISGHFTLNGITLFSVLLYLALSALGLLIIIRRESRRRALPVFLAAAVAMILSVRVFFVKYDLVLVHKEAIVLEEGVESKFEPFEDATTFFSLSAGESVNIFAERDGWRKVRRVDGKQGWVPLSSIEKL